jgi:hypothetical protein
MSAPVNTASNADNDTNIAQTYQTVKVDLRAAIDSSAGVSVFGPSSETLYNVVWCDTRMDVSALYAGSGRSLIEFWEPSNDRGNIAARIAVADRNAKDVAGHFASEIHDVLQGILDASAANPFQAYANRAYDNYASFGDLVLAYAAEGMFGHPSATAAITNDQEIVDGFNNDAKKNSVITSAQAPTQLDQALAQRLAAALHASSEAVATAIAQVVLGQDASRATNEDMNEDSEDAAEILASGDEGDAAAAEDRGKGSVSVSVFIFKSYLYWGWRGVLCLYIISIL